MALTKRLFFYEFSHPLDVFLQTIFPKLKHSLSLTLRHFFPFASKLICPPMLHGLHIRYSDGDSVHLIISEDSTNSFDYLTRNHIRDVKELHQYVPELSPVEVLADGTRVAPLMVIQVTVFPSSGICIGFAFSHVAADGMSFMHFVKSWANICKTNGDVSFIENSPPCHNKNLIRDPNGIGSIFLDFWNNLSIMSKQPNYDYADKVRATFNMSRRHIEKLKLQVQAQNESEPLYHASSFLVTCAFVWTCMVKAKGRGEPQNDNKLELLGFSAECRNRLEVSLPTSYFGNCLVPCVVLVNRQDLQGENGIIAAVRAIGIKIREMENEPLRGAEKWLSPGREALGDFVIVVASPKLQVYETDFGWGKPKKTEVVHIDRSRRAIALAESRDGKGGIEMGILLKRDEMVVFKSTFEQGLNML